MIDGRDAGRARSPRARRARRRLRAGGAARPCHRAALHAVRERAAQRPRARARWCGAASSIAAGRCAFVDRVTKAYRRAQGQARSRKRVSLSGGNLQKFVVGREILREPRLLVVSQPTWGVDAGAAAAIRQALIDLAARGAAVLVISQDLDELFEIADRLAVICAGRLSAPRATRRADRGEIGMLMAGVGMKGRRMRLALERRAERSIVDRAAVAAAGDRADARDRRVAVRAARQAAARGAADLFLRSADRPVGAAGNRREGDAAGADRGRPVALLPGERLEHRRRGPVPDRRDRAAAGSPSPPTAPTRVPGCCPRCSRSARSAARSMR